MIRRRPYFKRKIYREPRARTNEYIRISPIRLIDEKGQNLGIVETEKALQMAREKKLDLIEIAPTAKPPVCRIMSYGKYQYEKTRLEKQKKSNQKKTETKGIRIGIRTGKHDLETKVKQIEKFLKQGHKIKIEIILRGREKANLDFAAEKMKEFIKLIPSKIKIEQDIKKQPRGLNMTIANE
ncbi:translation initiation factor IF-3 [Patescibacteria group bacterium]